MKKLLSILLATMLFLPCLPAIAQQEDEPDSEDMLIAEKLYRIGILNDDIYAAYDPSAEMTRAQFADIAATIVGVKGETSADVSKVLADVTTETEYSSSIFGVYTRGVMVGDENAYFYPERSITYDEAITTAVIMLGLYNAANVYGGYSVGYREAAAKRGLTAGVVGNTTDAITQKNIFKLIDNMLDTPMFVISSYGEDMKVSQDENATILSENLGLSVHKGIITAYEYTSLVNASDELGPDTMRMDNTLYDITYTDLTDFVGYYAETYYDEDGLAVYVDVSKNNKVLTVSSDDIESATTLTSFKYRKSGGGTKTATIEDTAAYIYNGKRLAGPVAAELMPAEGQVTLVDNDRDGRYEVAVIEDYDVQVVDGVIVVDEKIKLMYGMGTVSLSEDDNVQSKIFVDGEPAEIKDLAKWNTVAIKKSKNSIGEILCEVHASTKSVEGKLTDNFDDGDKRYIRISDSEEEYMLSASYVKRVDSGAKDSSYPTFDKNIIFYIDIFGKVAAINNVAGAKNYGYLMRYYFDMENEIAKIKIYTKDAEFKTFDTTDTVRINDAKVEAADVEAVMNANGGRYQLILYTVNSEDKITKIRTAVDKTDDQTYVAKDEDFVLSFSPGVNPKNGNYWPQRFYKYLAVDQPYYFLEGTTINFQIPNDKTREKDFGITTKLSSTDVTLTGPIHIYDAGKGGMIGAIVSSPKDDTNYCLPAIVSKVRDTVDEDDVPCRQIIFFDGSSVYVRKEDVKYVYPTTLPDTTKVNWSDRVDYSGYTVDDIEKGDVIEFTKVNDYMANMRFIVKRNDMGLSRVDGDRLSKNGSIFGTVQSVSNNNRTAVIKYMKYDGKPTDPETLQSLFINGTVYKIDRKTGDIDYSSVAEIDVDDWVLVNSFWWSAKMVIVYK